MPRYEARLRHAFVQTPLWVYDLGPAARAAWHGLYTFAIGTHECEPTVAAIAERAAVSESTVKRGVRDLVRAGAVEVERRTTEFGGPATNRYMLHMAPVHPGVTSDPTPGVADDPTRPIERKSEKEEANASSANGSKALRDALWQALGAVVQWGGPDGGPERGDRMGETRFGRAVKVFVEVGATPAEVERRGRNYRASMPGVALTPEALVKHWSALALQPSEATARRILEAAGGRHG